MTPTQDDVRRSFPRTTHLPESERHRVLASERRRLILDVLAERSTPVDLADLAAAVATRESDGETDGDVDRVALTLHHVHLPKMAAHGVVGYDPDAGRIESSPRGPGSD